MASKSDYAENVALEWGVQKTQPPFSSGALYLALCTVVPTDASTGTTITEANYTGYARKQVAAADWGAASGGQIANSAAESFADCSSGSSVIIGWALVDAATVGNIRYWGTCTSKTVDVSNTPAKIAIGGIVLYED